MDDLNKNISFGEDQSDINSRDGDTEEDWQTVAKRQRLRLLRRILIVAVAVVFPMIFCLFGMWDGKGCERNGSHSVVSSSWELEPTTSNARQLLLAPDNDERASAFEVVIADLSTGEREAWQVFLRANAYTLMRELGSEMRYCKGLGFARDLRLLDDHWDSVLQQCRELRQAYVEVHNIEEKNDRIRRDYDRLERRLNNARRALREEEQKLSGSSSEYVYLRATIRRKLPSGEYEIVTHEGEMAALETTSTAFETTGRFEMWVRVLGMRSFTMQNGGVQQFPVVREASAAERSQNSTQEDVNRAKNRVRRAQQALDQETAPEQDNVEPAKKYRDQRLELLKDELRCLASEECQG